MNVFDNLSPGIYQGTVIDNLGNTTLTQEVELDAPVALSIDLNQVEENVTVNVSGGVPPYLYQYDEAMPSTNNSFMINESVQIITIIDSNNCSESFENILTSTDKLDANISIDLYPNPASHSVYINPNNEILHSYKIHDVAGKLVRYVDEIRQSNGIQKISVEEFPLGTYFLEVKVASGKSKVMKFSVL